MSRVPDAFIAEGAYELAQRIVTELEELPDPDWDRIEAAAGALVDLARSYTVPSREES